MNLELTKEENRLAERSFKKYRGRFYRKSQIVGWFGVFLLALSILPVFSWSGWLDSVLFRAGFLLINTSLLTLCMTVIGKLYARVQELETQFEQKGYEN